MLQKLFSRTCFVQFYRNVNGRFFIIMNYHKLLKVFRCTPQPLKIFKRGVSEYSKRMGYKLRFADPEEKVNVPKTIAYLAASGVLLYIVGMDKQKHHDVFVEHFDQNKTYYRSRYTLEAGNIPDMVYIIDEVLEHRTGSGDDEAKKMLDLDDRSYKDQINPLPISDAERILKKLFINDK